MLHYVDFLNLKTYNYYKILNWNSPILNHIIQHSLLC